MGIGSDLMAVRVRAKAHMRGVTKRIDSMTQRGQYALVNQVHADSNLYAPRKTGDMRNQSTITFDGKQIIWHAPYARRQYYNQFRNYTTPGTGPRWDQKALAIHGNQWLAITKKAMK